MNAPRLIHLIRAALPSLSLYEWHRVGSLEVMPIIVGGKRGKWISRRPRA